MRTRELLERLVGFPTVSRDSNLPLIDRVRDYLDDRGVHSQLVTNAEGTKANLFACIGPEREGGIVLSGHTDVVPVDGQPWSSDPFRLSERDGRLYGRGTSDMKGFIAVTLALVPELVARRLERPVYLAFTYDEEVGCHGAAALIPQLRRVVPTPAAVIVGEPTNMRIATAHKGICFCRTVATGTEAHSSLVHRGVSAVMLAGELIAHIGELARRAAQHPVTIAGLEPPFTTLTANVIHGGTAFNILAGRCELEWEVRTVPGDHAVRYVEEIERRAAALVSEAQRTGRRCGIETTVIADVPALAPEEGSALALVRDALSTEEPQIAIPFATEAGQYQQAGWSTVVCGPGDIDQAHRADEYVPIAQLEQCERFLRKLIASHCSAREEAGSPARPAH